MSGENANVEKTADGRSVSRFTAGQRRAIMSEALAAAGLEPEFVAKAIESVFPWGDPDTRKVAPEVTVGQAFYRVLHVDLHNTEAVVDAAWEQLKDEAKADVARSAGDFFEHPVERAPVMVWSVTGYMRLADGELQASEYLCHSWAQVRATVASWQGNQFIECVTVGSCIRTHVVVRGPGALPLYRQLDASPCRLGGT